MKNVLIVAIIVLLSLNLLNAQNTIPKIKAYKSWINLMGDTITIKGKLYEVEDSSIILSESIQIQDGTELKLDSDYSKIPFNDIKIIHLRKPKAGTGFLIGFLSGVFLGSSIGFIAGDDKGSLLTFTAGEKALLYSLPLSIIGGITGAIIGSKETKISIDGNFENFNNNKNKLKEYSIKNQYPTGE